MEPPHIIDEFRKLVAGLRVDAAMSSQEQKQQIYGAYLLATQLLKMHPTKHPKESAKSYLAELKNALLPKR